MHHSHVKTHQRPGGRNRCRPSATIGTGFKGFERVSHGELAIQWVEKHAEGKTAQEQLFKEWEDKIGPADDEDNHMKIQRVLADLWITAYSLKMQQLRDQTMQRKAELLASSILRTDSQRVSTNQDTD